MSFGLATISLVQKWTSIDPEKQTEVAKWLWVVQVAKLYPWYPRLWLRLWLRSCRTLQLPTVGWCQELGKSSANAQGLRRPVTSLGAGDEFVVLEEVSARNHQEEFG